MLTHLQIRDFAIVDRVELEFDAGMTAVTGETGAGKSIMLDALGLLLGDRAEAGVVREGADRAEISAVFAIDRYPAARAWLAERELEADGAECALRRVIGRDGRSRAFINGTPQPMSALAEFGERLVDIHGQHEHQSLMKRDAQRLLLDGYARLDAELARLAALHKRWQALGRERETLERAGAERDSRLELLRYQVRELEALGLAADELPQLEDEHARLANAGRLLDTCEQVLHALYEREHGSAQALLADAVRALGELAPVDPELNDLAELLNSALIQVQEAADALRRHVRRLDLDPVRLAELEQRLAEIQALARKHRCRPEDLPERQAQLAAERGLLENAEEHRDGLARAQAQAWAEFEALAGRVGARRRQAAVELSDKVSKAMHELGMPGGRFAATVEPAERPAPHGLDAVEFLVSANPGQPLKALAKVASGGELARISLALQVIAARAAQLPTLVFDEVDAGIGGGIAEIVGRRLRELGAARQVLCVTHLPQVAAQAHQHVQVRKETDGISTRTRVVPLAPEDRVLELARMLGGVELTEHTLAHAREMVERAQAH